MYTQCKIQFDSGITDTAWIPDVFAKKGNRVEVGRAKHLRRKATVLEVFGRTERDMAAHKNDWDKMKRRTDI